MRQEHTLGRNYTQLPLTGETCPLVSLIYSAYGILTTLWLQFHKFLYQQLLLVLFVFIFKIFLFCKV